MNIDLLKKAIAEKRKVGTSEVPLQPYELYLDIWGNVSCHVYNEVLDCEQMISVENKDFTLLDEPIEEREIGSVKEDFYWIYKS